MQPNSPVDSSTENSWSAFRRRLMVGALLGALLFIGVAAYSWVFVGRLTPVLASQFDSQTRALSTLPASLAEQTELDQHLRRLAEATKQGEISTEECQSRLVEIRQVFYEFSMAEGMLANYLPGSNFTAEQQEAARQTVRRYVAAIEQGEVSEETAVEVEDMAREDSPTGHRILRPTLDDQTLQSIVDRMEQLADQAGIADTIERMDICERVAAIVDRPPGN